MLGADVGVAQLPGLLAGAHDHPAGLSGESLEHSALQWALGRHATGVFLVDRLLADLERLGDLLPGPALPPGVVHLQRFEGLRQPAQREGGPEADSRVGAARCRRSEEHTSELQSRVDLVCRLLLENKKIFVNRQRWGGKVLDSASRDIWDCAE